MLRATLPSKRQQPALSPPAGEAARGGGGSIELREGRDGHTPAPAGEWSEDRAATALGHALDATADAFLLLDEHGVVRAANGNAERTFGRPGEPIAGYSLLELLSSSAVSALRSPLEAAANGSQRSADFPANDGHTWYVAHMYPAPDGIFLHVHDVTERHNAEEGLAFLAKAGRVLNSVLEERRLFRVVDRLVVPYLADWCLLVLHQPGGAQRLVASAKSRLLRHRLRAVATQEQKKHAVDDDADALLSVPPGSEALMFRRPEPPSSSSVPAPRGGPWSLASSIVKVPLVHRTEGTIGVIILGRANTRDRFRGTDLQLLTAFGSRVATVLDKVWLYKAEQRATRLRDEVLAIVAHDLRNPLHSIMLGATALAPPRADEQALHQAARQAILSAADQMNELVDDLVDAARLDADWGPRDCVRVDVANLVKASAQTFRWRAEREGVRLVPVSRGRMYIVADTGRLTEAISNLLDNALKFTPRGGTVTITGERTPGGIQISVADTGPGIDPEAMPHLFDRFWQARKSGRGSAGLGLFIAHRIVEGHGGRLTAESVLGKGSVFRIVLPTRPPARRAAGTRPDNRSDRT